VATFLLTVVVLTIGVLNLRERARWNEPSDGVYWEESETGLVAGDVTPGGPGYTAGIRRGDGLYAIGGRPIVNLGGYADSLYLAGPDGTARYGLLSGPDIREVTVHLAPRAALKAEDTLRVLLAFLYLGIGVFVLLRGVRQPRALHFYLICLTAFVLHLYSYTTRIGALDKVVYVSSVFAILLLPALFVHFCLRFPVDPKPSWSGAPLLYAPVLVLGTVQMSWWTGHLARIGLPLDARSTGILDRLHLVYLCAGLVAGALLLIKRRLHATDFQTRQQMKWVSYGTLAGSVPFVLI
jgi:hypothetical protein